MTPEENARLRPAGDRRANRHPRDRRQGKSAGGAADARLPGALVRLTGGAPPDPAGVLAHLLHPQQRPALAAGQAVAVVDPEPGAAAGGAHVLGVRRADAAAGGEVEADPRFINVF